MTHRPPKSVTQLLTATVRGDPSAGEKLWAAIYDELRLLARRQLAGEAPERSRQTTSLVSEAYEITWELHYGGQSVVYQTIRRCTKRKVALMVKLVGLFVSEKSKRLFDREIELVASLHRAARGSTI